jgi:acetoin utilization protein AcuB
MKVSQLMSKKLFTVSPDDSVEAAVRLLQQRGVRHLLVIGKDGTLVGIMSDRDIKRAMEPKAKKKKKLLSLGGFFFLLEPILVSEIMSHNPVSISPDASAQEAAMVMVEKRFGALPVVEDGKLLGIVTESDLLRYFAKVER